MVVAKIFVYAKAYDIFPSNQSYVIVEEELPPLKDGEYLAEAVYLDINPYMKSFTPHLCYGDPMFGSQVAKIIESKSSEFSVGEYVVGFFGWRTHTVCKKDKQTILGRDYPKIVPFGNEVPLSLALGALGTSGNIAYFGLLEICKPKTGETIVISGAAGAVGSHVGQIAKMKGLNVVGITDSDKKKKWLKSLGFDHVINDKRQNLDEVLSIVAQNGIDCYFNTIGTGAHSIILNRMSISGRIASCGAVAGYNTNKTTKVMCVDRRAKTHQQLHMEEFIISRWTDRWNEGILQNLQWIKEGKIKYKETVTEGFENMVNALVGVLQDNTGKAVVKV